MSRDGYCDDLDNWSLIRYRGAVNSAIKGSRGQALLRDLITALDAMEDKALIRYELESDGNYCALGIVGKKRGIDINKIDPDDYKQVAEAFNIAPSLAREVVFENDDFHSVFADINDEEERWRYMRNWAESNLVDKSK